MKIGSTYRADQKCKTIRRLWYIFISIWVLHIPKAGTLLGTLRLFLFTLKKIIFPLGIFVKYFEF